MYNELLAVIGTQLETALKRDIVKYTMIFDCMKNQVFFQIDDDDKKIPYDEPALADGLKAWIESNVNAPGMAVSYGFIFWNKDGKSKIDLHLTDTTTGEKKIESVSI